jgi:hypothetical protein
MTTLPWTAAAAQAAETDTDLPARDDPAGDWVIGLMPAGANDADLASIRVMTSLETTGDVVAFLAPSSVLSDSTRIYPREGHGMWSVGDDGVVACRYGAFAYDDRGTHVGELHMRVHAFIDEHGNLEGTYERRDLNSRGELYRFRTGALRGFRAREILRDER